MPPKKSTTPVKKGTDKKPTSPKTTKGKKPVTPPAKAGGASKAAPVKTLETITINLKQLPNVVLDDPEKKIQLSKKCALLIDDAGGMCATFLKYRDTNYLNIMEMRDMDAEIMRQSILGAVRYGKVSVFDTMEVNRFQSYKDRFDVVQKDLLMALIDGSFIEKEMYLTLIKSSDDFTELDFPKETAEKYKLVVITTSESVEAETLQNFYPIRVTN